MASLVLDGIPQKGVYIAAVSGGVDSTVLLHLLHTQRPQLRLVIAHVEHGIRGHESQADAVFVRRLARTMGYPFELLEANLGSGASEEAARKSRYSFLTSLRTTYQADGVMTAHHQDDVLETICLNIVRGTGWRGLCSLRSTPQALRPLLPYTKAEIIAYARQHRLAWRHDRTNTSDAYTRNRLRRHVIPKLSAETRTRLVALWRQQCELREQIEHEARATYGRSIIFEHDGWVELSRYFLVMVPRSVAYEVVREAALKTGGRSLQHAQAERVVLFAAAAKPGSLLEPGGGIKCRSTKRGIVVEEA